MKPIAGTLMFFIAVTTQAKQGAIVIHAGAGSLNRDAFTSERERLYHVTLEQSLHARHAILNIGGNTIGAGKAAIVIIEDATVFNAGKGAVFTAEGKNELDASIMNGDSLRAGAVGRVTTVKNTIRSSTRQRP